MGLRRSRFLVLVASLVFVTAGCDWSQFAYGPAHTSFNPTESAIGVDNVATLQESWTAPLGPAGGGSVAPVTNGGRVYASTNSFPFKLEVFDARGVNGCAGSPKHCTPLWTASVGAGPLSVQVLNGFVYVTTAGARLVVFDAAGVMNCSGTPKKCTSLWAANIATGSTPVITDSFVYAPVGQGVSAFDANGVQGCSGTPTLCKPLWSVAGWSPALSNGVLYVSRVSGTFEVRAYDAAGVTNCTGSPKKCSPLWVGDAGIHPDVLPHVTAPTISNGLVWIGINNGDEIGNSGVVVGFDAAGTTGCTGTPTMCHPIWNAATDGGVTFSPAVARNVVYVIQLFHSGEVEVTLRFRLSAFAVDACRTPTPSCAPLWSANLDAAGYGIAVANGVVYLTKGNQELEGYDAAGVDNCSGAPKVCAPLLTTALSGAPTSPIVANGVVFVGTSDDNILHAYTLP